MQKNVCKCVYAAGIILALAACSSNATLEGQWVEPVPGLENNVQGFSLEADGKASSINMATLQYKTWKQEGQSLLLSGESIGNAQTIAFTDTLVIERLTQDSLILKKGSLSLKYSRQAK